MPCCWPAWVRLAASGAALATTRVLESLLFGTSPTYIATFALVPVMLVAVAVVAAYLPARRATLVDPLIALRLE